MIKICVIQAGMKMYKSINEKKQIQRNPKKKNKIKRNKKKNDKVVFSAKSKLNSKEGFDQLKH